MLRLFGPDCPPKPVDPSELRTIPDKAVWIDLFEPTKEEEALAEKVLGSDVPTRDEMVEIEPSSRLYQRGNSIYMTMSVLYGIDEQNPASDPVSFILTSFNLLPHSPTIPTSAVVPPSTCSVRSSIKLLA